MMDAVPARRQGLEPALRPAIACRRQATRGATPAGAGVAIAWHRERRGSHSIGPAKALWNGE